jgi:hypothetical protein
MRCNQSPPLGKGLVGPEASRRPFASAKAAPEASFFSVYLGCLDQLEGPRPPGRPWLAGESGSRAQLFATNRNRETQTLAAQSALGALAAAAAAHIGRFLGIEIDALIRIEQDGNSCAGKAVSGRRGVISEVVGVKISPRCPCQKQRMDFVLVLSGITARLYDVCRRRRSLCIDPVSATTKEENVSLHDQLVARQVEGNAIQKMDGRVRPYAQNVAKSV